MFERFTDRSRKVMQLANQEAQRFGHEYIGTEHILLGLVKEGSGVAANVLKNLDVDLRKIRGEVEKIVQVGPVHEVSMGRLPQTPRAKKVIEYAIAEARNLGHNYVGTEHLLLGLLREQEGVAAQVLLNLGLELPQVRGEVLNLLGQADIAASEAKSVEPRSTTPALDAFGVNLTEAVRSGSPAYPAGVDAGSGDIARSLLCYDRNRVIVAGSPWRVRSALGHLAALLAEGKIPALSDNTELIVVNSTAIRPGYRDRALYRARVRAIATEAARKSNVILCATERRMFRLLSQRRVPMLIGVFDRFRRHGPEFEGIRRVTLGPLGRAESAALLREVRKSFEDWHRVKIADPAVEAAARLAAEGELPDSAIDLLDLACADARLSRPASLNDVSAIDAELEELTRSKEAAIAAEQFEKAVDLRDQAEQLKRQRDEKLAAAGEAGPITVTAEHVTAVCPRRAV